MMERIYVPSFDSEAVRVVGDGGTVEFREARLPISVRPSSDINKVFICIDGREVLIDPWALTDAVWKCVQRSRGGK